MTTRSMPSLQRYIRRQAIGSELVRRLRHTQEFSGSDYRRLKRRTRSRLADSMPGAGIILKTSFDTIDCFAQSRTARSQNKGSPIRLERRPVSPFEFKCFSLHDESSRRVRVFLADFI